MKYEYDVIVIGSGTAGRTAAYLGAALSAKTLLIEQQTYGSDFAWQSSIPGKVLLHKAERAASGIPVSYQTVMEKLQAISKRIYSKTEAPDSLRQKGIVYITGQASFEDAHTLSVRDLETDKSQAVTGRYIFIATGIRSHIPAIPGIGRTPYFNSRSIFNLSHLPESLIIIGAGPAGTELAQAYQRLGTRVSLVDMAYHILPVDPPEITSMLQQKMEKEGVALYLSCSPESVQGDEYHVRVKIRCNGKNETLEAEKLCFATGHQVNLEALKLHKAGIRFNSNGVIVNSSCRTNLHHVYAIGDVTGRFQLTHMSEYMAKVAVNNALLRRPLTMDTRHVPWVTHTSPQVAHVGATRSELEIANTSFEVFRLPYSEIAQAVIEEEEEGWILVYAKKWSGKILGVDIVGKNAGDLVSHFSLAMKHGISMRKLANTIYPYPVYALGVRRVTEQWYTAFQSYRFYKWLRRFFRLRGPVPDVSDPDRII